MGFVEDPDRGPPGIEVGDLHGEVDQQGQPQPLAQRRQELKLGLALIGPGS